MKARDYKIVEEIFNINVNVFGYENRIFPLIVSKQFTEEALNVLSIKNEINESRYVFNKDFKRLMYTQIKTKNVHKKYFCMSCLQNFTTKEILKSHRERCLLINDNQSVKYETETIKFKSFDKQMPTPFKICVDSQRSLKKNKY